MQLTDTTTPGRAVIPGRKDTEMTNEMKMALFNKVLELEHLGEVETFDHHNYVEQSNGAYAMLQILGLNKEYIQWSFGK